MHVETVEELRDQPGDAWQRQVGAERQYRRHAPVIGRQLSDRFVPQRGVHHQPRNDTSTGPSPPVSV
jgi:hypothetical protein